MPKVEANGITINYEQQGAGEPLILIPYTAADNACYAFQVAEYAKHYTCISVDPRGAGETDKPEGTYSTELFADDLSALMRALNVERAHISGLSVGGGCRYVACYQQKGRLVKASPSYRDKRPGVPGRVCCVWGKERERSRTPGCYGPLWTRSAKAR